MFAKLIKNIEVAARTGGGDPDGNPTLYDAIQKAKKTSVPNDNIDRAVKRGSGAEAGGADWQTITYEGYGPNGVARAHRVPHRQPQPRRQRGARRDDPQRRLDGRPGLGVLPVHPQGRRHRARRTGLTEDDVLMAVLDAGAEEVNDLGETFEVVSEATDLVAVRTALQDAGIDYDSAEATFLPIDAACRSTRTAPARCSGSSTRSRTATTCRTSTPTSTSPTRSWKRSGSRERLRRNAAARLGRCDVPHGQRRPDHAVDRRGAHDPRVGTGLAAAARPDRSAHPVRARPADASAVRCPGLLRPAARRGPRLRHGRPPAPVPAPHGGGWRDLLDDARRMSLTDFDHNRPLWEAALVEGLPGGQAAFLLKLHHSIADGQATVMMGLSLFEFGPEPDPHEAVAPAPPEAEDVGLRDVTYANLADTLRRGTDLAVATVRGALDLAKGTVTETKSTWEQAWNTLSSIGRVASVPDGPMSPVMIGRGTTYRFAAFDLPFAGIRAASKELGLNVNDAFMASIAIGMDAYHRRHGVVAEQLRVNVPISLRGDAGDRTAQASNSVSIARFPIPIAGLTAAEHMAGAHELVAHWKQEPAIRLADPLAEVSWLVPVPMLAQAAQASDVTTATSRARRSRSTSRACGWSPPTRWSPPSGPPSTSP